MPKILVTGYGAFLSYRENPSEKIIQDLGVLLKAEKHTFPVIFSSLEKEMRDLKVYQNDVVLLFGLAASRKKVTLEHLALNWAYAPDSPDNEGKSYEEGEKLRALGREAFFSTFPVEKLHKSLNEQEIESEISFSAGTYVCNATYYYALEEIQRHHSETKCCFIHLPSNSDVKKIAKALAFFIESLE